MRLLDEFYKKVKVNTTAPAEIKWALREALKQERNLLKEQAHHECWGPMQVRRTFAALRNHARFDADVQFASYFPIHSELNLRTYATPSWIFPKTVGEHLLWFYLGDEQNISAGRFTVPEAPLEKCFPIEKIEKPLVLFVPCLAASVQGQRLGYGGGFYDRFLHAHRGQKILSVACVHSQLLFDKLPTEEFDERVDCVVTETEFMWLNNQL